jgi:hypothetical protein
VILQAECESSEKSTLNWEKSMKNFALLLSAAALVCAAPAFANVTITSPDAGAEVVSPFHLVATASECSSQIITSVGYSIDNSNNWTIDRGSSIDTDVASITGAHTVYVKSWGQRGAVCETPVAIIVVPDPATLVPSDALIIKGVQALSTWQAASDTAIVNSTSSGNTKIVASPSLSGKARQFATEFTNYGGERYSAVIGDNTEVTNFLYDGWVYLGQPSSAIANIELDMNQVMSNGQTVIYGFQCDGYSGTWDYTANEGTPEVWSDVWLNSAFPCNPRSWSTNTWHHVQITYSRDEYGSVTYQSVWFDGVEHDLNASVSSAFALGWAPVLLTNFQIDGLGAGGSSTTYLDKLTVYAW